MSVVQTAPAQIKFQTYAKVLHYKSNVITFTNATFYVDIYFLNMFFLILERDECKSINTSYLISSSSFSKRLFQCVNCNRTLFSLRHLFN